MILRQTGTSASGSFLWIEPMIRLLYYNTEMQNELYRID